MLDYFKMLMNYFAVRAHFADRQGGATLVEYALIIAVIALAIITSWVALFSGAFTSLGNAISSQLSQ